MNTKFLIILFCLFFNLAWGGDSITLFHNSKIKLPQGFKELSEDNLRIFKETIFTREIMTVYEKKNSNNGIQRIIIYYDSLKGTKNLLFDKIVELKLEVIKEDGIDFDDVTIDKKKHCVYGKSILHGETSIFGFSVDYNGMMGIQFANSNGINSKDKEDFKNLITSIKHVSPYQYEPEENQETKDAKKEMEQSGLLMTIAFVAMIVIWLIRKYIINS